MYATVHASEIKMCSKAKKAVSKLKARGFKIIGVCYEDDRILLVCGGFWGISVPLSEKTWCQSGKFPLEYWYWDPEDVA